MVQDYRDFLAEVLISEEDLQRRITEMGEEISNDYQGEEKLLLVCILRGGVMFLTDLMRQIHHPHAIEFMAVSSYGAGTTTSGAVKINKDLNEDITGRHVIIVEDILDSGVTLSYLCGYLENRKPASITLVTLLDKPARRKAPVKADFIGFEVPDEFVVGYGLDYAEKYRNLPFVGILKPEVYSA